LVPVLARAALQILTGSGRKVTQGLAELVEAGLATEDGRLTEQGELVKQILTKPRAKTPPTSADKKGSQICTSCPAVRRGKRPL
jgi:hypothetical protein